MRQIIDLALPLVEEVARSEIEDAEINSAVAAMELLDLQPLVTANALARSRAPQEARELSREPIEVWVKQGTDFVIENEDLVEEILDKNTRRPTGKGQYRIGSRFNCERRAVERVSFQAAMPAERPGAIWDLRIPFFDRPGLAFDGTWCRQPHDVLIELQRASQCKEPAKREVEVALVPRR
jgi:hypothetical protein